MADVRQVSCAEASEALARGERRLIDVRTPWEWELVHVPGAELLDDALFERLRSLPTGTPLAFLCHHGVRSHQAAAYFADVLGFADVWNVAGGIDRWAVDVDPALDRY